MLPTNFPTDIFPLGAVARDRWRPGAQRRRTGAVGQRYGRCVGDARAARRAADRRCHSDRGDALPLRRQRHAGTDHRRPRAARRGAAAGRAPRRPVLPGHQVQRRHGSSAPFMPVPHGLRRARPGHVGDHRLQCGQRRGRGEPAPYRHPQGHRLHPRPGRPRLCRAGADPGRRRHGARRRSRQPAGDPAAGRRRQGVRGRRRAVRGVVGRPPRTGGRGGRGRGSRH